MNLKTHLLTRIVFIAVLCLLATAAYVLLREDQQSRQKALTSTESVGRQLEVQLLRIDAGFDLPERFPDLDLWKEVTAASGLCVRFTSATTPLARSVCSKGGLGPEFSPKWFEALYRQVFHPDFSMDRPVRFKGRLHGSIAVSLNGDITIARAWDRISDLITLSAVTVLSVCLLIYATLRQSLQPVQLIVEGLEKMQTGELSYRLPDFELIEWQRTGMAINQLAQSQEQLFSERRKLTLKIMTVQEEERRYLARELHDELGQCLAGIHAVAASIAHTAEQRCPVLVPEANNISRITNHIMSSLRALLLRLRPTDIDELGLSASLNSLVSGWNVRAGGKIHYHLAMEGALDALPEPLPVTVFRIIQECITNIARHSGATHAQIKLEMIPESKEIPSADNVVFMQIKDDGCADSLPFFTASGVGLLGLRERVSALGGRMALKIGQPSGLAVSVWLPVSSSTKPHA